MVLVSKFKFLKYKTIVRVDIKSYKSLTMYKYNEQSVRYLISYKNGLIDWTTSTKKL